jgi:hypothetical protein
MANLVLNPGFETAGGGGADVFANWVESGNVVWPADEGTIVRTGSHACKLTAGTPAWQEYSNVSQTFTVTAGQAYTFSFWARCDSGGPYQISRTYGWVGWSSQDLVYVGTSYYYREISFFVPAGKTSVTITISTGFDDGVIFYVDDVTVDIKTSLGDLDETLDAFTLSATGTGYSSEGTLDVTLDAFALSATGTVYIEPSIGTLEVTLDTFTLAALGTGFSSEGDLAVTLGTFTLAGTGVQTHPAFYYSPGHPNCMVGFGLGTKVKVEVDGIVKFVGRIAAIRPEAGQFENPPHVEVEVHDWAGYLSSQELGIIAVQEEKTADQAITTTLSGFTFQPEAYTLASGIQEFLLIFDTESPDSTMASFYQKLCMNELGRIYVTGSGILVFDGTMNELNVSYETNDIYNVIQSNITVVEAARSADVQLWDLKVAEHFGGIIPAIPHGQNLVLRCPFTDPALGGAISAIDVVDPIVTVEFGSTADFVSNDMITDLGQSQEIGGNMSIVTLTNNHATDTGYLNDLQIYGRPLYNYGTKSVEVRDTVSISGIGERRLQVYFDEIADIDDAEELANILLDQYSTSYEQARKLEFYANTDATLLANAISIEPSTRILVKETVTGIDKDFWVNRVKYTYDRQALWVTLLLDPVR